MSDKIKFSQLEPLSSSQVKTTAIFPIVQDGENYQIALSSIPSSGGGSSYDHTLLENTSGSWVSNYTTTNAHSAEWSAGGAPVQQNLGVIAGNNILNTAYGESAIARLSGDTTFTLSGASEGESGMIVLGHEERADTWTVGVAPSSTHHVYDW